ncbi:MAG: ubiquinol-cytochrome c reductase iron-sulfur subunit [Candidatus Omnitrophica bacterium]|nr:ubiquinol-cytochrome c reductase iron-sulfur subunit [Candidatus Omnitrophota bacterium]
MNEPIQKRLKKKFGDMPKWAEDFSIEATQDKEISRRDFIRFLGLVSLGLFTGTLGILVRSLFFHSEGNTLTCVKISGNDLSIGESRTFTIPGKREPGILVRLSENRYVAYGQKCTHLQCPVLWKKEENKLMCPCHNGAFDVTDGHVLYGPPERPLPVLDVEARSDGIYFMGIKSGMLV